MLSNEAISESYGWIEVEKREALGLPYRIEDVAVDRGNAAGRRGRRTGSVEFYTVQFDLGSFGQLMKRCSGAGAGIDGAGSGCEIKQSVQSCAFRGW